MVLLNNFRKTRRLDHEQLRDALARFRQGDFSVTLPADIEGTDGLIAQEFNEVVLMNQRLVQELDRISQVVGKEGRISQRASLGQVTGAWQESINSVNALINDLVHPTS